MTEEAPADTANARLQRLVSKISQIAALYKGTASVGIYNSSRAYFGMQLAISGEPEISLAGAKDNHFLGILLDFNKSGLPKYQGLKIAILIEKAMGISGGLVIGEDSLPIITFAVGEFKKKDTIKVLGALHVLYHKDINKLCAKLDETVVFRELTKNLNQGEGLSR